MKYELISDKEKEKYQEVKVIFVLIILLLTGCNKEECLSCQECKEWTVKEAYDFYLKNKLIEYGKLIYTPDDWQNKEIDIGTHYMDLGMMEDNN